MDYSFTANIEEEFDKIAEGKQFGVKWLVIFTSLFMKDVEHTLENAERAKGERELGVDPVNGKPVYCKNGKVWPNGANWCTE